MSRHTPQNAAAFTRKTEERAKNKEIIRLKDKINSLHGQINHLHQDMANLEKMLDDTQCNLQDALDREDELKAKLEIKELSCRGFPVTIEDGFCKMVPGWEK